MKALPKRDTTVIDLTQPRWLSALQLKWLRRRWERRQDAYVIVGSPEGSVLFKDLAWEQPLTTGEFRARALGNKELMELICNLGNFS